MNAVARAQPSLLGACVLFVLALPACGLHIGGTLATDHGAGPDGDASVPGAAGGHDTDGGRAADDAAAPTLTADGSVGGGAGGGGAGDGGGAPGDGGAGPTCFPTPRECTTAADCTGKGGKRCCLAVAGSTLTATCRDECDEGRVAACLTGADCSSGGNGSGICSPRVCACGDTVLACGPLPGACL
jgi:hypothetical protein